MGRDWALSSKVSLYDLHGSAQENKKWNVGIVRLEQDFARPDVSQLAARPDAINLSRCQYGKGLSAEFDHGGWSLRRHDSF
jgi:hypothetical protein